MKSMQMNRLSWVIISVLVGIVFALLLNHHDHDDLPPNYITYNENWEEIRKIHQTFDSMVEMQKEDCEHSREVHVKHDNNKFILLSYKVSQTADFDVEEKHSMTDWNGMAQLCFPSKGKWLVKYHSEIANFPKPIIVDVDVVDAEKVKDTISLKLSAYRHGMSPEDYARFTEPKRVYYQDGSIDFGDLKDGDVVYHYDNP